MIPVYPFQTLIQKRSMRVVILLLSDILIPPHVHVRATDMKISAYPPKSTLRLQAPCFLVAMFYLCFYPLSPRISASHEKMHASSGSLCHSASQIVDFHAYCLLYFPVPQDPSIVPADTCLPRLHPSEPHAAGPWTRSLPAGGCIHVLPR